MVLALLVIVTCTQQTSLSIKQKRIAMDYFILTDNSFFRLIRGETEFDPNTAYQEFVVQIIDLCKHSDDEYKTVALSYAETELMFISSVPENIDLYAKKALAFIRKMQQMVADGKFASHATSLCATGFKWTGKKADFVELIYGLQTMGVVNDGKTNVRELLNAFNSMFGDVIPFDQCYGTYEAIKRRKLTAKAAFLESMLNGLHNRMKEDDRKEQARR